MDTRALSVHGLAAAASAAWAWAWFSGSVPGTDAVTLALWSGIGLALGLTLIGGATRRPWMLATSAWLLWLASFPLMLSGIGIATALLATCTLGLMRARTAPVGPAETWTRALGTTALLAIAWLSWRAILDGWGAGGPWLALSLMAILAALSAAAWWPVLPTIQDR